METTDVRYGHTRAILYLVKLNILRSQQSTKRYLETSQPCHCNARNLRMYTQTIIFDMWSNGIFFGHCRSSRNIPTLPLQWELRLYIHRQFDMWFKTKIQKSSVTAKVVETSQRCHYNWNVACNTRPLYIRQLWHNRTLFGHCDRSINISETTNVCTYNRPNDMW